MEEEAFYQRQSTQKIITEGARLLAEKLNKEIEKGNDTTAFMLALLLAGFKDFLDIILTAMAIGLIPGVNFVVGLFLTSFLFFFMLGKGWFLKWRLKFWFWVLGLFIDGLPGFSALPINSLLVLYAWRLAKKRKDHAEVKMRDLSMLTHQEIDALNKDIALLENEISSEPRRTLTREPRYAATDNPASSTPSRSLVSRQRPSYSSTKTSTQKDGGLNKTA